MGEQIARSGTSDLRLVCTSQGSAGTQAKALYRSSDGVTELSKEGLVARSAEVVFADADHGWVSETGTGLWRRSNGVNWQRIGR